MVPAKIPSRLCFSLYPHSTPWTGRGTGVTLSREAARAYPESTPLAGWGDGDRASLARESLRTRSAFAVRVAPSRSAWARSPSHSWQFPSELKVQLQENKLPGYLFSPGKASLYPQQSATLNHLDYSREEYGPFMFSFTSASGGFPNHVA